MGMPSALAHRIASQTVLVSSTVCASVSPWQRWSFLDCLLLTFSVCIDLVSLLSVAGCWEIVT